MKTKLLRGVQISFSSHSFTELRLFLVVENFYLFAMLSLALPQPDSFKKEEKEMDTRKKKKKKKERKRNLVQRKKGKKNLKHPGVHKQPPPKKIKKYL